LLGFKFARGAQRAEPGPGEHSSSATNSMIANYFNTALSLSKKLGPGTWVRTLQVNLVREFVTIYSLRVERSA